jgi:nucleoside phosphorylase
MLVAFVEDKLHSNRPQTYLVVACGPELEKMTDEHRNLLDELNIKLILSGVGGYNAADTVQDLCTYGKADWIINVGTAGSHVHPIGSIVCPTLYGRRDVDATFIMRNFIDDFSEYMIPFENEMFVGPWQDRFNTLAGHASGAARIDFSGFIEGEICWTGDNTHAHLETTDAKEKAGKNPSSNFSKFEVVEMEAWWMAKKCQKHRIPFTAFKWISDGADDNVGDEWAKNADGIPWDDILLKIKNAKEWNYSNSV